MTEPATATMPVSTVNRRARVAVAMLFLTNGAVFANLLPRYPRIKAELGLSNAALGTAIAAFPLGALIAGLAAGSLIHRFRSSRIGVLGTVLTAIAILIAAQATNWWMLAAALFVGGALDAIVDVAQNAHGLRVQRRYGRSILNSFHALWSVGAVIGGLMGSAAAGLDLSLTLHLGVSGVVFSAVALVAYRFMLPGPEASERDAGAAESVGAEPGGVQSVGVESVGAGSAGTESVGAESVGAESVRLRSVNAESVGAESMGTEAMGAESVATESVVAESVSAQSPGAKSANPESLGSTAEIERTSSDSAPPSHPAGTRPGLPSGTLFTLLALGVIACCGTVTEDAGASWGALYLSGDLGAAAATAGLAFVALQGMQFVGRLLGDRLVDRFGQRMVARFGGAITAIGMGVALAFPSTILTIVGFGAAGLGVATLVPATMHAADELPGLPPGAGLTVVTWLLRLGFLLSPPVVGLLADASSLRVGLLLVPIAGVAVVGLSRFLAPVRA